MTTTWNILIDWDKNGNFSGTYDDIAADYQTMSWRNGINNAYDVIAPESTCQIVVRNTDGKYNPDNTSSPLYGNLLPGRPVKIQGDPGTGAVVMFRGFIQNIMPGWAPDGPRTGKLTAVIECIGTRFIMQNTEVNLPLQTNQRTDEIIALALQQVVLPPAVAGGWLLGVVGFSELGSTTLLADAGDYSTLDTGTRTCHYYGDIRNLLKDDPPDPHRQNEQSAYRIIRDMAEAEPGRFFQGRNGKAIFHNRDTLIDYVAPVGTVDDSGVSGQKPSGLMWNVDGEGILNRVRITVYPRESESSITLWTLDQSTTVPPGDYIRFDAKFTDNNKRSCGASGTVSASAVTSNNGTTTASLDQRADRAIVTLTNTGTEDDLVTALSITGTALMATNEVQVRRDNHQSVVDYGNRAELTLKLRGVDDYEDAVEIADFQLARRTDVVLEARSVSFTEPGDGSSDAHLFSWDLGDRLHIIVGDHDAYYWIIGETHTLMDTGKSGIVHQATFMLEPHHLVRLAGYGRSNRDSWVSLKGGVVNDRLGQQFQVSANLDTTYVKVFLGTIGSPTHNYRVRIYSSSTLASGWLLGDATDGLLGSTTTLNTDGAYPDTLLATSATISGSEIAGTPWVTFTLSATLSLTASTTYWLVLEANDPDLVSFWPLDEASGTRTDAHGSNDLTDNNTVTQAIGLQGNAAEFVAANSEYLSIADASQSGLDLDECSIALWFYMATAVPSGHRVLVSKYDSTINERAFMIIVQADQNADFFVSGDGTAFSSITNTVSLATLEWHFLCARHDGSNLKLRVNDTDATPVSYSSGIYDSSAFFGVGYRQNGVSNYFDGRIGPVGVWSRALTDAEVTYLYNVGRGRNYDASRAFPDASNYIQWGIDSSSPGYASGEMRRLVSGGEWIADGVDAIFEVYQ